MADGLAQGAARALETMHPMREPPPPASLAPFAVTLAVGCAAGLALLALAIAARRRRAGLRAAAAAALARTRTLAPPERLAAQAALLRRLVRQVAGDAAARLQGAAWLGALDRVFATTFFTKGAGMAYGDALYAAQMPDVEVLDAELAELFARMRGSGRLPNVRATSGQTPSSDPDSRRQLFPQGGKG